MTGEIYFDESKTRKNIDFAGNGKLTSSLQEELQYIVDDFTEASFAKG